MLWPRPLNNKIKNNTGLAGLTTFKIGGKCRYYFEPASLPELKAALKAACANRVAVYILGAGSNILVPDAGLNGLVIRLNAKVFCKCVYAAGLLTVGSGLKTGSLVSFCVRNNLTGLEFLAGIPGTLGGSLAGNAGAWGNSIGRCAHSVGVMDYSGKYRVIGRPGLKFTYRCSNLKKYIILWARLKVKKCAGQNKVSGLARQIILKRKSSQGDVLPNAGCVFRNPANESAGRLIEASGLKGRSLGKAMISRRHANFILNTGGAKSKDVLALMELAQNKVRQKFKVKLRPEIVIWK